MNTPEKITAKIRQEDPLELLNPYRPSCRVVSVAFILFCRPSFSVHRLQTRSAPPLILPDTSASRAPLFPRPLLPTLAVDTMPGRTLPSFTAAQVASHSSAKSCYVTVGRKVYDVTDFLDAHPGGSDLVLEYAGKDIEDILKDESSHAHSEAAYEVLDDSLVGFLAGANGAAANGKATANGAANGKEVNPRTGMSSEEDLSKDTDIADDYKTHKFLDLSKPLLMQVWNGGFTKEFYLEQVHRPRHYRGGASAPLFGNFLEPLSKTPWWLIPIMWVPPVVYGLYISSEGFDSKITQALWWVSGLAIWTLLEYILHRFLFHLDEWLPDNRVGLTMHFLLHGIHHYLPMDKYRLVMPPTLFIALATPFWKLAHTLFYWDWSVATTVYCGGIFGYICYDLTHYFLHHQNLPLWYKQLKKYHLEHHFLDYQNGFGVTSRFWDTVFGTELQPRVIKTQ
ncbi:inositolphosphorylceramide-B C-26 hydroxylase [Immersiella caudata]|uniref:Inositolphosphorylceramide-B C-26 hydroxylase n=1 Tax=Immersiella caudata TaxID=314043 RepID=A0AA40C616_9PEZI|nr:inositolphosphorylceramide-B C-26 hydroxylase [Immersiella caudata]